MENTAKEQFTAILAQAIVNFAENVKLLHYDKPNCFDLDPSYWLTLDSEDQFQYIMNDDYWVREWSTFLLKMLVDEIHNEKESTFSLN